MSQYPPISETIIHNPRPVTGVLEIANAAIEMSTSPSLLPQTELEPPPNTTLASSLSDSVFAVYPQLILFGDSITQFSTLTLQAYLQTQYIRRLDVVNRGFSGYTATMGLRALQKFLPSTTPRSTWPQVKIVTVFFGANDACVPGDPQHVELQSYIDTVNRIIEYPPFNQEESSSRTNAVIITPPPVNEHQFGRMPSGDFQRRAGITSQYARAAREMGEARGVPVLDLWTILMHKVGWEASMGRECCCDHIPYHINVMSEPAPGVQHIPGCHHIPADLLEADYQLCDFLTDGLHLTKLGYDILFWELMKLIKQEIPDCAPENLPFVLSEWRAAL